MKTPLTLLVMAGGLGSRFGGLKQLKAVGPGGETIAEFSAFDALRAGFTRFVFVIKPGMAADFEQAVLRRLPPDLDTLVVEQRPEDLPEGVSFPAERTKPLGTAHAVWSARGVIGGPFAVINADDFYGPEAFSLLAGHLSEYGEQPGRYCIAGYHLRNTVTENGSVARGICQADAQMMLTSIAENTDIRVTPEGIVSYTPEGPVPLAGDTLVSMNAWGFTPSLFPAIGQALRAMMALPEEKRLTAECYLPAVAEAQRREGSAQVRIYPTKDLWYGVTYAQDLPWVRQGVADLVDRGLYPRPLWGKR